MFETILIPTDGSSDAMKGAEQGVALAAQLGATVHAVYVVREGGNPWDSRSMEDQATAARTYGEEIVGSIGELAAERAVPFVGAVRFGPRVYAEINEYVEEEGVDLIVMGSGYHGELGGLLGSTAEKVLRTAHVPVMTLRRELRESDELDESVATPS